MKRSDGRILTTHAGSLPRPVALLEVNRAKLAGETLRHKSLRRTAVHRSRGDLPQAGRTRHRRRQRWRAPGQSITARGQAMPGARLSGWEPGEPGRLPALAGRRDRARFAEFYAELDATSFRSSSSLGGRPPVFTGPIAYVGQQAVRTDLANFKAALAKVAAEEAFITAVAPGSFARRQNRYYGSDEAFLHALAEPLRVSAR
jgi:5-methyltetrahydropteroyltriglutamate--homocysteine methyltransferase